MARWTVLYQTEKGNDSTVVDVPGEFKTAVEVHRALIGGEVPGAFFIHDKVIGVQLFDEPPAPRPAGKRVQ